MWEKIVKKRSNLNEIRFKITTNDLITIKKIFKKSLLEKSRSSIFRPNWSCRTLRSENYGKSDEEIKNKIFRLPFLKGRNTFDESVAEILKFLLTNDLKKSKTYIEKLLEKKEKCY